MLRKGKNLYQMLDDGGEKLKKKFEKSHLNDLEYVSFNTHFNDKGVLEYACFRSKQNGRASVRFLRLLQVKSVSNEIRQQINNEESFRNILNQFAKDNISFVTLYAHKPGENLIVGYGLIAEGWEQDHLKIEKETALYIKALEDKFRSVYTNIEIEPITIKEEWLFEGFFYEHLTVVRGIPKPDPSIGIRVGTSQNGDGEMAGRQVSEILLKGMTANRQDTLALGYPFLMYTVFDRLDYEETERSLLHIQNTLGKLATSREVGVSEHENFSFPLLFGFGFGEMMGQSTSLSEGVSEGHGISDGTGETQSVSKGTGEMRGLSETETVGSSETKGKNSTSTEAGGGTGGASFGLTSTANWSKSDATGTSEALAESESMSKGSSQSQTFSETESNANSKTHTLSETQSTTVSKGLSDSSSQNNSSNMSGGVSGGDGSGINRRQIDHFFQFAIELFQKNEYRFEKSLRDGMYDYRMFLLTAHEQAKITAEELVKQSYTDNDSPFPIRIVEVPQDEEKKLKRYVKAMAKPKAPEVKPVIPEKYRYSTYITPQEATAFNLPQENLAGYLSSFDPIPPSVAFAGKMGDGASIGNQINRHHNLESSIPYVISEDKQSHIGIFGATNTGKTVFVQQFVSSLHNKFGTNFLLFDWTRNHRSLMGHLKDSRKFRYNSFEKGFFPLRINLVESPPGVSSYIWNPVIAELMCYSMGLGDRSYRIIIKVLKRTQDRARESGYVPTMEHFVRELGAEYSRRMGQHNQNEDMMDDTISSLIRAQTRFMPSNEQQSFGSMIERMEEWLDKEHPVYQSMCGVAPFISIDQLIEGDFVHLIECAYLPQEVRQFVINGVTAAIFHYCKCRDVKLKKPAYIMFEEAHTVLKMPTGNEPLNVNETIFETINREARNFNLLIGYICQSPEKLPPLIFDNLPLRVVFQIPDDEGKKKIISAGGRDGIRLDVNLVKWLSRQPMGTCLIRNSKFTKIQDAEFVAVKVHMLPTDELSNQLFKTLYMKNKQKNARPI